MCRRWLPKLYKPLTAALKKKLKLSSTGVVKRTVNSSGKISVSGPQWYLFLHDRFFIYMIIFLYNCHSKEWWATAEGNSGLPKEVWSYSCQVPPQRAGGCLKKYPLSFNKETLFVNKHVYHAMCHKSRPSTRDTTMRRWKLFMWLPRRLGLQSWWSWNAIQLNYDFASNL